MDPGCPRKLWLVLCEGGVHLALNSYKRWRKWICLNKHKTIFVAFVLFSYFKMSNIYKIIENRLLKVHHIRVSSWYLVTLQILKILEYICSEIIHSLRN